MLDIQKKIQSRVGEPFELLPNQQGENSEADVCNKHLGLVILDEQC